MAVRGRMTNKQGQIVRTHHSRTKLGHIENRKQKTGDGRSRCYGQRDRENRNTMDNRHRRHPREIFTTEYTAARSATHRQKIPTRLSQALTLPTDRSNPSVTAHTPVNNSSGRYPGLKQTSSSAESERAAGMPITWQTRAKERKRNSALSACARRPFMSAAFCTYSSALSPFPRAC